MKANGSEMSPGLLPMKILRLKFKNNCGTIITFLKILQQSYLLKTRRSSQMGTTITYTEPSPKEFTQKYKYTRC